MQQGHESVLGESKAASRQEEDYWLVQEHPQSFQSQRRNQQRGDISRWNYKGSSGSEVRMSDRNTQVVVNYASNLLISLTEHFISTNPADEDHYCQSKRRLMKAQRRPQQLQPMAGQPVTD